MHRRTFLKLAGAGAAGSLTLSAPVAADHFEAQPDHVTLAFDRPALEQYQPMLVTRELNVDPVAMYGWIATSAEHETDVYVYAASYTHQEGLSPLAPPFSDSHFGDHEWFYVYVDEAGDVEDVVYATFHWLSNRADASVAPMHKETHPKAHVVNPWHNYYLTCEAGQFVDLADLTTEFQGWLDNGLEDHLEPGTVVNPWTMLSRGHWWRDTVGGFSFNAFWARTLHDLGFFKADLSDLDGELSACETTES